LSYKRQQIETTYTRRNRPRRSAYGGDFDDDELDEYDFEAGFKAARKNRPQPEESQVNYDTVQPGDDEKVKDNWVQKSTISLFISFAFIFICATGSQNFFRSFSIMPPDPNLPNFEPDEVQIVVDSKKQPSKKLKPPDARTIDFGALLNDT